MAAGRLCMVVVYQVPPSCTATSTAVAAARRTAVQQPRHDPAAAVRTRARVMIRKQSAVGDKASIPYLLATPV